MSLFDMEPLAAPIRLSADQRRTQRQSQLIRAGIHPLSAITILVLRLHPAADRDATRDDPRGQPYTCGTCSWRQVLGWHDRAYPKCAFPGALGGDEYASRVPLERVSHGAATDVRAWWPACVDYQPGDPGLSPDAARCIPGDRPSLSPCPNPPPAARGGPVEVADG